MLVDPLHPSYTMFCELTRQEEELGLLSRTDIGTKQGWLAVLAETALLLIITEFKLMTAASTLCRNDAVVRPVKENPLPSPGIIITSLLQRNRR